MIIDMSITVSGTIGVQNVTAVIQPHHMRLVEGNNVLFDGPPWLICFQRESSRLKTCDAVYITGQKVFVHTIETSMADSIRDVADCPMYRVGSDPLPWSKFLKDALKYGWDLTDWQHLLEEDTCTDQDSSDTDWEPGDVESSDDDDIED